MKLGFQRKFFSLFVLLCGLVPPTSASFNLSNTLGDGMVLQRAPQASVVWGFGMPGTKITTDLDHHSVVATVGNDGIWRQILPVMEASIQPTDINFSDGQGTNLTLHDVSAFEPQFWGTRNALETIVRKSVTEYIFYL